MSPLAERLGEVRSRHHGTLSRAARVEGFGSSRPWLVFEVRDRGVAIQPDPRGAAKFRRYSNVVLEAILRPIPFWLGMGTSYGPETKTTWDHEWEEIKEVSIPARKTLVVTTKHDARVGFRFGSSAGLKATVASLAERGITTERG